MATDLKNQIEEIIKEKNILDHPFYQKWNEGTLTKPQLQEYAKQYYKFVEHFPRFVSSVHSNCGDKAVRKLLLENLADEEGYKTNIEDHPRLWLNFCEALNVSESEVKGTAALPETQEMVDGFYELCRDQDYLKGVACLLSYEQQVPEVSKTKIAGLKKFYDLSNDKDIEFFTVHKEADIHHSREELDIILNNAKTEEEKEQIRASVEKGASLLWKLLDGVYNNYCLN